MYKLLLLCMLSVFTTLFSHEKIGTKLGLLDNRLTQVKSSIGVLKNKLAVLREEFLPIQQPAEVPITYDSLQEFAEVKGYGYKTANLMLLRNIFKDEKFGSYAVSVPEFVAISSQEIKAGLNNLGCNVDELWQLVIRSFDLDKPVRQKQLFDSQNFPEGFFSFVKSTLERKVESTMKDRNILSLLLQKRQDISIFLRTLAGKKNVLMVRSTGKEDSATIANAGGNKSIPNVSPADLQMLQDALQEVVCSYFQEKSLRQRVAAKDPALFRESPFIPVLFQRMIGEDDLGKNIPRCGVMFTEEAEGAVSRYVGKDPATGDLTEKDAFDPKRIATSGITIIQAAYGHNEGVVNSLIVTDSYFVDGTDTIYPVIKKKTSRLVPLGARSVGKKTELIRKNNTSKMQSQPALNRGQILALKKIAERLESVYKKPMDVEFVIDPKTTTIYLVQARPIIHAHTAIRPSYVGNSLTVKPEYCHKGLTIGVGAGAVGEITKPEELIVENTLPLALARYQKSDNKNTIKAIIVGTDAPATSHEATAFRSEQKPVLFIKNIASVRDWVKELAKASLIIDVQKGLVLKKVASWHPEIIVGWSNYPIPPIVSSFMYDDLSPEETAYQQVLLRSSRLCPGSVVEYLEEIKTKRNPNALLRSLVGGTLRSALEKAKKVSDSRLKQQLESWISMMTRVTLHCEKYSAIGQTHKFYQRRIFPLRMLEALLSQQPSLEDYQFAYSSRYFDKILTQEQSIAMTVDKDDVDKTFKDHNIQLRKLGEHALSETTAAYWDQCVNHVLSSATHKDTKQAFITMVAELAVSGIASPWINTLFNHYKNKHKENYTALVTETLAVYAAARTFLLEVYKAEQLVKEFDKGLLDNPSSFFTVWRTFSERLKFFVSDKFIRNFKEANSLGKMSACLAMSSILDYFDQAIKVVTGSMLFKKPSQSDKEEPENKAYAFKQMLMGMCGEEVVVGYITLLEKWLPLAPDIVMPQTTKGSTITIDYIKNIFQNLSIKDDNALEIRESFDVSKIVLGIVGYWSDYYSPQSLEEMFTFIHQSLIEAIARCSNGFAQYSEQGDMLTKLYALVEGLDPRLSLREQKPMHKNTFVIISKGRKYNISLNSHSATIEIKSKNKKAIEVKVSLVGGNEFGRWDQILAYAAIAAQMMGIACDRNDDGWELKTGLAYKDCDFTWIITTEDKIPQGFMKYLHASMAISFSSIFYGRAFFEYQDSNINDRQTKEAFFSGKDLAMAIRYILQDSLDSKVVNLLLISILEKGERDPSFMRNFLGREDLLLRILEKIMNDEQYAKVSELQLFKRMHCYENRFCFGGHLVGDFGLNNYASLCDNNHEFQGKHCFDWYKNAYQRKIIHALQSMTLSEDQQATLKRLRVQEPKTFFDSYAYNQKEKESVLLKKVKEVISDNAQSYKEAAAICLQVMRSMSNDADFYEASGYFKNHLPLFLEIISFLKNNNGLPITWIDDFKINNRARGCELISFFLILLVRSELWFDLPFLGLERDLLTEYFTILVKNVAKQSEDKNAVRPYLQEFADYVMRAIQAKAKDFTTETKDLMKTVVQEFEVVSKPAIAFLTTL